MKFDHRDLKHLLDSILTVHGYDFTDYSEASMMRRVDNFMNTRNIGQIDILEKMILKNEKFFEEFVQELSVTVTEMFRDPLFYKSLRQNVIKRLATYPFIKIWIAGCATGEEVYSLAILLSEEGLLDRSIIYATDINQKSIQIAKEGVYPVKNMKEYTANYQKSGGVRSFSEYYLSKYDSVMFDKSLKRNIVFSPHNLAVDKSFNEFELILCRNVLIYFKRQLQNKVVNLLYESLVTFGFLGLGNKETLLFTDQKSSFEEIDRQEKIYMKNK
jgi:chemotaxis protein methyltransferase CheR